MNQSPLTWTPPVWADTDVQKKTTAAVVQIVLTDGMLVRWLFYFW